jgi:uncharacterized protein DUF664
VSEIKRVLHAELEQHRAGLLAKLDGLGEHDLRRPMTPTGTNLLGLVKHLAGIEYGYFGDSFGRPPEPQLPWVADGSAWDNADMWATEDESSEWIVGLYRDACAHGDETIRVLSLESPARVPWWPAERADTTLGSLLVRVLAETARHAGHADIVRELVDGETAFDRGEVGDAAHWRQYVARIEEAAAAFPDPPDSR